ncbi:DUF2514 family protein [Variovorax sp. PAMC26660]|uniref:DUF2514 family protein n=1 Tax=Variovorax sp. PAMC26660 TaxID=2762322 RepID=UPI00164CFB62|nr:DUF2514 family protein [Variovorax sp. PAMC26660]QNK66102.1 DUF2514 family protein [Variovorax sp. PAMC26660]
MPDFRTPMLWALCLGLAAALLTAGVERTRGASARTDAAKARQELAEYRSTVAESGRLAERAQRTQEQTWRKRVDGVIKDGQQQIAAARADAVRAADAERRVRKQLDTFRAAVRAASAEAGPAGGSPPAEAALDLLANLLGGSGAALVELGKFADGAHIAGSICERYADAVEPAVTAATSPSP